MFHSRVGLYKVLWTIGDHLTASDLLERARLAPFARRALRNVALWMLLAACKEIELSRLRAALLSAREGMLAPAAAEVRTGGRLADLLAYEARISTAREWPINASTLLRLGFYMTLGLGSWVGAGVVQHVIEKSLR
jgi:hypothetical protein